MKFSLVKKITLILKVHYLMLLKFYKLDTLVYICLCLCLYLCVNAKLMSLHSLSLDGQRYYL